VKGLAHMGKKLLFPHQAPPCKPPRPATVQTLWDKLELLDRVRPGALSALTVVADQFLVAASHHKQSRSK